MRRRFVLAVCGAAALGAAVATAGGCSTAYSERLPSAEADAGGVDGGADAAGSDGASDAGDGSPEAGAPCDSRDPTSCGPGQFCLSTTCGPGTCAPMPSEGPLPDPQCGCDGVTYWNATVAARARMPLRDKGVCPLGPATPTKVCGGVAGAACKPGQSCSMLMKGSPDCSMTDPQGQCWQLPLICPNDPAVNDGGAYARCDEPMKCASFCQMVRAELPFYATPCGP